MPQENAARLGHLRPTHGLDSDGDGVMLQASAERRALAEPGGGTLNSRDLEAFWALDGEDVE